MILGNSVIERLCPMIRFTHHGPDKNEDCSLSESERSPAVEAIGKTFGRFNVTFD